MSTRTPILPDGSRPPTAHQLESLLGDSFPAFKTLTARGSGAACEWKRYGNTAPWTLKVRQGDRTLFYVTPRADAFEATIVLGEQATAAALNGRVPKRLHAAIRAARAYVEGRPVRVIVKRQADVVTVEQLVAVKLDPAGRGRARPRRPRGRG